MEFPQQENGTKIGSSNPISGYSSKKKLRSGLQEDISTSWFTEALNKFTACVFRLHDHVRRTLAWLYLPVEVTSPPHPRMVSSLYL